MKLETKTVAAKVTEAKADGTATAIVSVFGNVDLGGDRVLPGAFTRSLDEWKAKGDPIPVIWSHDWDNPESFVGWADPSQMKETDAGLEVPMQFDLDRPRAEQVHHLLKTRRVTQFSFGYFARAYQDVEDPDYGTVRELSDIDLFEVGPTLLGMNPETELLQAASALRARKAGRVLSAKNEGRIRGAYEALGAVLSALDPEDPKAAQPGSKRAAVKATAEEAVEGAFVTWADGDDAYIGRIEHVMTEGVLGVEDSPLAIEATPEDPAILVRLFDDGLETEELRGVRASEVEVTNAPASADDEVASLELPDVKAVAVPAYVSENAARGLALYEEGRGGDGLVEQTIRDARDMVAGEIRDEKVRLMGPWIARHIVDLEAPQNSDPDADGYPGAGLVAMLLWGAGPDVEGARRTQAWAEAEAARLDEDDAESNGAKNTEDSPADAGDSQGTIPSEHILALLTRPRNTEE